MKLEFYKEADLLRCTKDELINHIFELRKKMECIEKNQGALWDAVYSLKRCDIIKDIWENCD